jgi:radical SAM superfamily enzyme YgiQ (UPF0313 family)
VGKSCFLGLESGSEDLRKIIGGSKANVSNEEIIGIVQKAAEFNLKLGFYIILGYPKENQTHVKDSYALLKEIAKYNKEFTFSLYISLIKIQPGSKLYEVQNEVQKIDNNRFLINPIDELKFNGLSKKIQFATSDEIKNNYEKYVGLYFLFKKLFEDKDLEFRNTYETNNDFPVNLTEKEKNKFISEAKLYFGLEDK